MPCNGLALPVFIGREEDLVDALEEALELGDHLLLARGDHVERLEPVVDVDRKASPRLALVGGRHLLGAMWEITDVADRRLDDEVGAED